MHVFQVLCVHGGVCVCVCVCCNRYLRDPENFFVISSDFCHWGERFRFFSSAAPLALDPEPCRLGCRPTPKTLSEPGLNLI
jgi:predicted class III extradiol MEMO1 family dioxygenase